jgi:hypothetical protein
VVGIFAAIIAHNRWITGALAFTSFHLHLMEDVLGPRGPDGYQWPIPYLVPFSKTLQISWAGQWRLDAWQNVLLTVGLLAVTMRLAWRSGFFPLEMASTKGDAVFVNTLRRPFPRIETLTD